MKLLSIQYAYFVKVWKGACVHACVCVLTCVSACCMLPCVSVCGVFAVALHCLGGFDIHTLLVIE